MAAQVRSEKLFVAAGWGERMRLTRRRAGLTLEEVGKAVGVSEGAVSRWESESSVPSRKNFEAFAELVEADVSWLQFGVSSSRADPGRRVPVRNPWLPDTDKYDTATIECCFPCSPRAFAVEVFKEGAMPYRFGDIIVVDPDVTPQPGDIVLAMVEGFGPEFVTFWPNNSFKVLKMELYDALREKLAPPDLQKVFKEISKIEAVIPPDASDIDDMVASGKEEPVRMRVVGVVIQRTTQRWHRVIPRKL